MEDINREVRDATDNVIKILEKDGKVADADLNTVNSALKVFEQAIRIKPNDASVYFTMGVTYCALERWSEAREVLEQVVRIEPDNSVALLELGRVYRTLERWDEGLEVLERVIQMEPDNVDAHMGLGIAYNALKRWHEARKAFGQAIRIEPDNATAYIFLVDIYCALEWRYEAQEALKEAAMRVKPNDVDARFRLGLAYLMLDDKSSALKEYKILKNLDKDLAAKLFKRISR
ncbi:MAG: tetratricopeptide repeat protein [Planctomycetota bacterium]|nr:tetratricopeptide repeat protein [Planctomycetota bacterium]